jgi:hypothetical protein
MFALCSDLDAAARVSSAMREASEAQGTAARALVCRVDTEGVRAA